MDVIDGALIGVDHHLFSDHGADPLVDRLVPKLSEAPHQDASNHGRHEPRIADAPEESHDGTGESRRLPQRRRSVVWIPAAPWSISSDVWMKVTMCGAGDPVAGLGTDRRVLRRGPPIGSWQDGREGRRL